MTVCDLTEKVRNFRFDSWKGRKREKAEQRTIIQQLYPRYYLSTDAVFGDNSGGDLDMYQCGRHGYHLHAGC